MQFLFHPQSGADSILLEDEPYRYLIKARREKEGAEVHTRNLQDDFLHTYAIESIGKRDATLRLVAQESLPKRGSDLHIGWCVVDPKTVEKSLPMLNQTGVGSITFITCAFSQKNFRISEDRLEKILINSCEQSGRSDLMGINFSPSLSEFLKAHPECAVLDFNPTATFETLATRTLVIGCEGGFSDKERALFGSHPVVGFASGLILKSETAALAAAAKMVL